MTVKQLVKRLSRLDQERPVFVGVFGHLAAFEEVEVHAARLHCGGGTEQVVIVCEENGFTNFKDNGYCPEKG